MRTAIVDGHEVQAASDAPRRAICANCGKAVKLHFRNDTWYYRHEPGSGKTCPTRSKPGLESEPEPPRSSTSDPWTEIAMEQAAIAARDAKAGDVQAALVLAFNQMVTAALDKVGVAPEEVLEIVPRLPKGQTEVLVTLDVKRVLRQMRKRPGPIFDLRPRQPEAELADQPWYVPLHQADRAAVRLVRLVLGIAKWVYVLGDAEEWKAIITPDRDRRARQAGP